MEPPDKANPDMRAFPNTLFEQTEDDVLAHCTNGSGPCLCCRSFRAQGFRLLALAMGFHGAGNQAQWEKPVLQFYQAAWKFDASISKSEDCPPLDEDTLNSLRKYPNPRKTRCIPSFWFSPV